MNITCIVPAAGHGKRMKSQVPKQFLQLGGEYVLEHTLKRVSEILWISEIILVVNEKIKNRTFKLVEQNKFEKVKQIVIGGKTRTESVLNGLNNISSEYDWIVVHDGARPLVSRQIFQDCVKVIKENAVDAVVPGIPVEDTIKRIELPESTVEETLARVDLREIQTPQLVRKEKIMEAFELIPEDDLGNYTDDSHLLEEVGAKIKVIKGEEKNLKITTPLDLKKAEFFLKL